MAKSTNHAFARRNTQLTKENEMYESKSIWARNQILSTCALTPPPPPTTRTQRTHLFPSLTHSISHPRQTLFRQTQKRRCVCVSAPAINHMFLLLRSLLMAVRCQVNFCIMSAEMAERTNAFYASLQSSISHPPPDYDFAQQLWMCGRRRSLLRVLLHTIRQATSWPEVFRTTRHIVFGTRSCSCKANRKGVAPGWSWLILRERTFVSGKSKVVLMVTQHTIVCLWFLCLSLNDLLWQRAHLSQTEEWRTNQ